MEYVISDRDQDGELIEIDLPPTLPTAFVCNCDQVARKLIEQLEAAGLKVPEDCSIVGFDNDFFATTAKPELTTLEVDTEKMAALTVGTIMTKLEGQQITKGAIIRQREAYYS